MRPGVGVFASLALLTIAGPAAAGTVSGLVYIDVDGSGSLSPGDRSVAGAAVYWETSLRATTDAAGQFSLVVPDTNGMVWVRAPDGMSPAPVWRQVNGGAGEVDLGVVEAASDRRPGFIHASDTHTGKTEVGVDRRFSASDMMDAFSQAIDPARPPMFVVVTGDIASGARVEHYEAISQATSGLSVPFVPVPGNHDWYDSGVNYRAHLGPPMYSFEAGGGRFVVLNDNGDVAAWERFIALDLTDADPDAPVIAFIHRPPNDFGLDSLEAAGVDHLFSGHWHSNLIIERGNLTEYNTQPLYSGGIDTTPGGYRVVDLTADGLDVRHHNVMSRGHARITAPLGSTCAVGDELEILAAVELGDGDVEVELEIGGQVIAMEPVGGWQYRAVVSRPIAGAAISLTARRGTDVASDLTAYTPVVCEAPEAIADWTQLQGNASNTGYTDNPITAPLVTLWTAAVGGHVHGGSPVVAGNRVFVPVADFAGGLDGALVALDLTTGRELWRHRTGAAVRNAAAVDGDVVVVGSADGIVAGLEAATGELRWSVDLSTGLSRNVGVLHAAPTIADGVAYVGVHRRFAAIEVASGQLLWEIDPATSTTLTSLAAAAVRGDRVIGTVARGRQGLFALSREGGTELWRSSARAAVGAHASPVLGANAVYLSNAAGEVVALDVESGEARWTSKVVSSDVWDYGIIATPALAHGRLYVPTQYDRLAAIDTGDGSLQWSIDVGESPLRTAHTRTVTRSVGASPVVTANVLWVGGADGVLRAVDPGSGDQYWQTDLGSPITSGLTPAGQILVVASYDGTVRAMINHGELPEPSGCGCGAPFEGSLGLALLLGALLWRRRRTRRGS